MPSEPGHSDVPWNGTKSSSRSGLGLNALRLGLGTVWAANLVYIFDPANQYWPMFSTAAASYGSQSIGGSQFANFVASYPTVFAALIAAVTVYLAFSFLLGFSTRLACLVGFGFSLALFVTQWAEISTFPGGTDIGAPPLYMAMFVALYLGYDAPRFTLDRWILGWSARRAVRHGVKSAISL
jgi:hypothetical protein